MAGGERERERENEREKKRESERDGGRGRDIVILRFPLKMPCSKRLL